MNGIIECHFDFSGDFDPHEITSRLSIKPTSIISRGTSNPALGLPLSSGWTVSVGPFVGVDALNDDILTSLIEPFLGKEDEIKAVARELNAKICLSVWLKLSSVDGAVNPNIRFPSNVVAFLSSVDAEIDIDAIIVA